MTYDSTTHVLSGTPTASGVFPITFTSSNGVGAPSVQNFTLTVNQAPAITSALFRGRASEISSSAAGKASWVWPVNTAGPPCGVEAEHEQAVVVSRQGEVSYLST